MVRAGACSPSKHPSLSDLEIDSAIVEPPGGNRNPKTPSNCSFASIGNARSGHRHAFEALWRFQSLKRAVRSPPLQEEKLAVSCPTFPKSHPPPFDAKWVAGSCAFQDYRTLENVVIGRQLIKLLISEIGRRAHDFVGEDDRKIASLSPLCLKAPSA